jgi:phage-related protein
MFSLRYGKTDVRFEATDPWIYSNTEKSVTASPGTTTGGLHFPLDFPLVFGVGSSGGSGSATNAGTAPAPWTATITGSTPNPKITHVESGKWLELSGLTVEVGQTLEFDSKQRSILLNGTASRRGLLTPASTWFALQPGSNTIQFSSGGVTTGQLTFKWRDTYWSD